MYTWKTGRRSPMVSTPVTCPFRSNTLKAPRKILPRYILLPLMTAFFTVSVGTCMMYYSVVFEERAAETFSPTTLHFNIFSAFTLTSNNFFKFQMF